MLQQVAPEIRELYVHIQQVCATTGREDYLPRRHHDERTLYNTLLKLRNRCREKPETVSKAEYLLLSMKPRILRDTDNPYGEQVFGGVKNVDGAWRWDFEAAGVPVHSEDFSTEKSLSTE